MPTKTKIIRKLIDILLAVTIVGTLNAYDGVNYYEGHILANTGKEKRTAARCLAHISYVPGTAVDTGR